MSFLTMTLEQNQASDNPQSGSFHNVLGWHDR
jgi:hypothetical protein